MSQTRIIIVDKDEKTYVFTSLKKASEVLGWIKPKSIYNVYRGLDDFTYKGARIRRLPLN